MRQLRILRIRRNDHCVRPEIRAALRQIITHVLIFRHDIGRIAGIYQSKRLSALRHVVNNLISDDFRLHRLYAAHKPLVCLLQLLLTRCVH